MKTVNVNCAGSYDILIEKGIFENAGNLIKDKFGGKRFCVITDENVAPLYLDSALKQLEDAGLICESFVFPSGEGNKNMATVERILEFLADRHYTRSDMLIALGG